jgi:putative membrane protein
MGAENGSRRRFPASVYERGAEPDARFSLANERTFLAWIRTGLAFLAAGVALESLGLGIHPGFRLAASIVLVATGVFTPIQAWFGWMGTERALREARPLPAAALALPIGASVTAVGVLVLLGVIWA